MNIYTTSLPYSTRLEWGGAGREGRFNRTKCNKQACTIKINNKLFRDSPLFLTFAYRNVFLVLKNVKKYGPTFFSTWAQSDLNDKYFHSIMHF
jgi:hypothetical protein